MDCGINFCHVRTVLEALFPLFRKTPFKDICSHDRKSVPDGLQVDGEENKHGSRAFSIVVEVYLRTSLTLRASVGTFEAWRRSSYPEILSTSSRTPHASVRQPWCVHQANSAFYVSPAAVEYGSGSHACSVRLKTPGSPFAG